MTHIKTGLSLFFALLAVSLGGCCCCSCDSDTVGTGGTTGGTACALTAANDTATACPGTGTKIASNIPVLANDNLAGGIATVTITAQGTKGTAVVNADKTITYAATSAASTGQDTFTYQVSTGTSCSKTATVTVLLDTDTPTANAFTTVSVATSSTLQIGLAAHVTPATVGLTYAIDTSATQGTATVNPTTGVVSYTAPATVPGSSTGTPAVISGVTIGNVSSEFQDRPAVNLVNGNGLQNFTTIGTGTHSVIFTSMWNNSLTDPTWTINGGPGHLAHVTFDLGDVYDVTRFQVWNWNQSGEGNQQLGIRGVTVSVSESNTLAGLAIPSGAGITNLASPTVFAQGAGNESTIGQVFSVSFRARYVRFDALTNYESDQTKQGAALSEVRFEGTPATDAAEGTDTFTYTVTDACGNTSAAGTVTIPITAAAARLAAAATAKVLVVNNSSSEITVFVGGKEVDVVQPRGLTIVPRDVAAGDNQEIRVDALSASPQSNKSTSTTANLTADATHTITYTDDGSGNTSINVAEE